MAGNDELFQAFGMLSNSVQRLGKTRALVQANDDVEKIRLSDLKDAEKENALRDVASRLAPAVGIEGAQGFANMVAPRNPPVQSVDQGFFSKDPEMVKRAQALKDREHQQKLEEIRVKQDAVNKGLGLKTASKDPEKLGKQLDIFRDKVAKPDIEALNALDDAITLRKVDSLASLNLLKNKLIRGSGDNRIGDEDRKSVVADRSLSAEAKRNALLYFDGKPFEKDFNDLNAVAEALKVAAQNRLRTKAKGFAKTRAQVVGTTPAQLENRLRVENNIWHAKTPIYDQKVQDALDAGHSLDDIEQALIQRGQ